MRPPTRGRPSRFSRLLGAALVGAAVCVSRVLAAPHGRDAAGLFDEADLPLFELKVDPRDWERLRLNAKVPAQLRFDGEDVGKVSLRCRGSYGTLYRCLSGQGPVCRKMSFKMRFDRYRRDARFFGLKTLNFEAMVRDKSLMHDRLAYWVFREMGVPAPRAKHVRISVNGAAPGVFLMVEQVDREFLRERFSSAQGPLYKAAWPVSADADYYAEREKSAAGEGGDKAAGGRGDGHADFIAFHRDLASSDLKDSARRLGRWVDVGAMMRYLAVDFAIRDYDGVTAFYCGKDDRVCGNHNFYWYLDPASRRFWLIPWDLDWTFQPHSFFNVVPAWDSDERRCGRVFPTFVGDTTVKSPACDPLFRELAAGGREAFREQLRAVLAGPLREGVPEARIDAWAARLEGAVRDDPDGLDPAGWRQELERLKRDLEGLRVLARAKEKGEDLSPLELSRDGLNDFERVTRSQVLTGVGGVCNARSSLVFGPNQRDPLRGDRDFRADFSLRDEEKGFAGVWPRWAAVEFALKPSPEGADLSGGWRLRLRVRSDAERVLRVGLASPAYRGGEGAEGILCGWQARVGPQARTLEFVLDEAAYPDWARVRPDARLSDVLKAVNGLSLVVLGEGRVPRGERDAGFLQVDDVEFVKPR